MLSRSSTTRYFNVNNPIYNICEMHYICYRRVVCGSHSTGLTIQTIVNDGEFDFQLMGTKTEHVVSGSLQNLGYSDFSDS